MCIIMGISTKFEPFKPNQCSKNWFSTLRNYSCISYFITHSINNKYWENVQQIILLTGAEQSIHLDYGQDDMQEGHRNIAETQINTLEYWFRLLLIIPSH